MSGSSLDGLDVCLCEFDHSDHGWNYKLLNTTTLELPQTLMEQLRTADQLSAEELTTLDLSYGSWIGEVLKVFLKTCPIRPELIGIHGHTVFHDPIDKKISLQIGNGVVISESTGIAVVDNFRMADISLGGQGAPLVPAGEHHLFPQHSIFLNLGGICNLSIHSADGITAWDIAPCNQVFNHFAQLQGQKYDSGGNMARSGQYHREWSKYIRSLDYFKQLPPKSLSNQWTQKVLAHAPQRAEDALHTYAVTVSQLIADAIHIRQAEEVNVLVTGGGALNQFLVDQIKSRLIAGETLTIPDPGLIAYKEALIFGFLALLRKLNIPNVYASVTGAQRDSVSGDLHDVG
ncbi:anhydro-N-acetylmuramic acid kinase [Marinoscillum sp.]|uniref:anhydro-N-acetylmuramic acid kinase n=1 Tax=Marinoscillum sp. TaxID=2024838 RepID=UPI003BAA2FA3